ncbi:hypothetical protein MICCA_3950003 [Microcystis aeruginosa PCC 9432]|uniref:Uncharacterized protein n=1 Tax=Microcystis aeruginosa PCC 9432 TaxID=1160280 RepID=A0A822LH52_MICAE|nr:hypothetical protein MICCA_3950003 [Microcystis aeruginosa PCC 9432]
MKCGFGSASTPIYISNVSTITHNQVSVNSFLSAFIIFGVKTISFDHTKYGRN